MKKSTLLAASHPIEVLHRSTNNRPTNLRTTKNYFRFVLRMFVQIRTSLASYFVGIISTSAIFLLTSSITFAQTPNLSWARAMSGAGNDYGRSIATDASGNVYTTGNFEGTVDFDPSAGGTYNLTSAGGVDFFISKLDASGNFVWAKAMGGPAADMVVSIVLDPSGNVYTTGYFSGTADFDPSAVNYPLSSAGEDIFISKLDASGNFVWAKVMFCTAAADAGQDIAIDPVAGTIYTTGYFSGTVDFNPGAGVFNLTSSGGYDIFISQLDASGNFVWAYKMGGSSGQDVGYSIAIDAAGKIYTTGSFQGTADFDPSGGTYNLNSSGAEEIFVSKLDAAGNFVWAKQMGGSAGQDAGYAIVLDAPSAAIYTTGIFQGTADFDPSAVTFNLNSAGGYDMFISKLDVSGNFVWAKRMGGTSDDFSYSITTDASGNVYTAGHFQGTLSAGAFNLTSAGLEDIFISKLDASGNFTWAYAMGATNGDAGYSIATDASGNIYTTGGFRLTVDFDPGAGVTNLTSAGINDVFVHKMNQCNISVSISSQTNVSCFGGNNGSATVSVVSGGTSPFTYSWNTVPAQSSPTATNLSAGTYSVLVTDANSCTATANVTVTQPGVLSVMTGSNQTICPGGNVGLIGSASGGTPNYTYNWSPVAGISCTSCSTTGASPTVTTTYTLTATDANGCTAQASVVVTVNTISISLNTTNVSCNGGSDGSATATPTGGTIPYTYAWNTAPAQTTQTATGLFFGTYIVTVTDAIGCTATANLSITQPPFLSVSNSGNVTICSSQSASISGTASGGIPNYTYNWSPAAGISCTTCNSTSASPTVTTTYTLTATDANGCIAMALVMVSVNPSPSAPIAGSNSPICTGNTLSLTASSTGTTYSWSGPNGFTSSSQNPTIAGVTTASTGCYSVTATTSGCTSTAAITCVTINQTPAAPTVGSNSPVCEGNNISLTASSTGTTYSWSGPNSFTSTSQNPTIAGVTTTSSGTYSVTATSSAGCISTVGTTSVTVNQMPSAPTASSNSPVNAGNTLSLSASTIAGATYSWSGNTFSSSLQNPTIASVTTANAGCYSVTATVNGCTSSAAITCVTVITISITTSTQSVSCNGGNDGAAAVVTVTGGNAPYTYSWSTSPVQTTQAVFNLTAGTYTVTVTDASGSSSTATVNVTQPSPITVFTNPTNVSCYGGSNGIANAIAGGGTSPYIYSWNSFPVQTTATAANLSAGNYMVTVTDANGCTGTNTVAITQPLALTVSMTITNTNCGATDGIATANVSGGTTAYSYLWSNGGTTQQISNLSAGTYSVTVTDSKGCTVSAAATIGIIASNFSLAFSGTPQNGPSPLNVTFSNTTPSMSSYNFTWYWGDGNNVNNNNATVFYTYNFSGTYNVALIATSIANGCTDTLVKAPYINVTGAGCTHNATVTPSGPLNACVGDTVILTAGTNAVAPFTYQWNIGAVAISGANSSTLAVTQSGYYSVTIIKNNCPVTSSAVQVNFTTLPQQPVITSAGNIVPCVGGSSTLTSSSISGVTYSWNTTPVQTTQSIIVSSSGNYVVTVTNGAGCSTSSAPFIVNASLAQVPICLVTVDSLSQNNIIAWEKQLNQPIDSFIVYREIATNNYQPIGAVLYDSLSLFIDTVRTKYFPNTGDPNSGTYRYKIAVRDTCGNYSPLSPYHNTIYIINNSGTFFWTQLYTIENASNPVTTYDLLRDDNSTGVWNVINSVAGTQQTVTDPNYATYQSTASWRVKTQWGISCTATIKYPEPMATNLNSSRSNIYKVNNPISVNEAENNFYVNVYPNPNSGIFQIQVAGGSSSQYKIEIYNVFGECVYRSLILNPKYSIDLSKKAKGVYYLQITSSDKVVTKKIIIE